MNLVRMNLLLDVLKHVPPDRFDLAHWVRNPETLVDGRATCGTGACAAGWLALDPRAQAEGLEIRMIGFGVWIFYKDKTLINSLTTFFDSNLDLVEAIFLPHGYSPAQHRRGITPGTVARRVRKIMKENAS